MNRLGHGLIAAAALAAGVPGFAQSGSTSVSPPVGTTPPATTSTGPATPPGPTTTGPATPATTPVVVEPAPPAPVAIQPSPPAVPAPAPITISPDAAYPNGFQDPADPFANSARADNDRDSGFPWGLVGLLGLLGLIPLFRGNGARTVYVERDEPRRVVIRDEDPRV